MPKKTAPSPISATGPYRMQKSGKRLLKRAAVQLSEYFDGRRRIFDLPLDPRGTAFQKSVWSALQDIPYGETRSYKDIACAVGNQKPAAP